MKKQPLDRSFGYAFEGIWNTVKSERNMQIHLGFTVCVIIAGLIFRISKIEWLFCLVLFGQVMSLELVNTALEAAVDVATVEWPRTLPPARFLCRQLWRRSSAS